MLIPKYWAQHKQRFDSKTATGSTLKQATIKRYGWSDISQAEALSHAKQRVAEAHSRWLVGEDILRRERDGEYNEVNSIPIREAIISKQSFSNQSTSQVIVTRNSYGAQVANVDNIAIIDIDTSDLLHHKYPERYSGRSFMPALPIAESIPFTKVKVWFFVVVFILTASIISWLELSWLWLLAVMISATAYLWQQASNRDQMWSKKYSEDLDSLLPYLTDLIQKRIASYPNESFRLYETPAGFRIIAVHDLIVPSDNIVAEWFDYFHADANYARLCQVQQCFRARLTAKPWRMNEVNDNKLDKQIPAKDFWFIDNSFDDKKLEAMDEEQYDNFEKQQAELVARQQWIERYDEFAKNYKACRYIGDFKGRESKPVQTNINEFIDWHDGACQVDRELPMA